jgi:GxxExxY protein
MKKSARAIPKRRDGTAVARDSGEPWGQENAVTERVIGCAIEVHKVLGPGLLESIYEGALCVELSRRGLSYSRQAPVPVTYKGEPIADFRLDLVVEDRVVVEIKAVERLDPVFDAQLLSYLRLTGRHVGLLINFNSRLLKQGLKRLVL